MSPSDRERLSTSDLVSARATPGPVPVTPPAGTQDPRAAARGEEVALFPEEEMRDMKSRWQKVQTGFVDEPRRAVEEADHLVATTIQQLAESFARARRDLEEQWARGSDVSTEDLRQALRHYRSFFDRLLAV